MTYRKRNPGVDLIGSLICLALVCAIVIGWGINIAAIAHSSFTPFTPLLVLRLIGIFVFPLGAILGFWF